MITLSSLADEKLNKLVANDNAPAMREKARRYMERGNHKKARQFFTLSSILGDRFAHIELAKIYEEEENFEEAYSLYARAYSKGEDSVLPRIAVLAMKNDPDFAIELLRQNAFEGHWGCIKELVNIYRNNPENPEYQADLEFWVKRLDEMEKEASASIADEPQNKAVQQVPDKQEHEPSSAQKQPEKQSTPQGQKRSKPPTQDDVKSPQGTKKPTTNKKAPPKKPPV